jgi:transposase
MNNKSEIQDFDALEAIKSLKQMKLSGPEKNHFMLTKLGDPLEEVSQKIDFEICRPMLNRVFQKEEIAFENSSWDYVLLYKILLLQFWHDICDNKIEFVVNDTLTFMRFLGVSLEDELPDNETILQFRDILHKSGIEQELFELVTTKGEQLGVLTHGGRLPDTVSKTFYKMKKMRKKGSDKPSSWEPSKLLKIFLIQDWYKIPDDKLEFRLYDSLSFQILVNIHLGDEIPSAKACLQFRSTLMKSPRKEEIFGHLDAELKSHGTVPLDLYWDR